MQTKQRISLSLPIKLATFVRTYSKNKNKTQSAIIADALKILQRILEEQELKESYLNESDQKDFAELASTTFYHDFLRSSSKN
jgi:hypothetical protein